MKEKPKGVIPLPGVRWRGLTIQLFVTLILPLAGLLVAVAVGAAYFHQQAMRNLVGERDQRATVSLARALEVQLTHRLSDAQSLAWRLADGTPPEQVLATSAYLRREFDAGMAVLTWEGQVLAAEPKPDWWNTLMERAGRAWWPTEPGVAFSAVQEAPDGSRVMLVAATADGRFWALGAFHPSLLAQRTLMEALPGLRVSLWDRSAQPLFVTPADSDTPRTHPGVEEALRGERGVTYFKGDDGEHVIAFSPVQPVGWALVIEESWENVANPWLHTTQLAPLLLVPLLLLALVGLWFGARQVVEPLQQLEARAAEVAWGNYEALAEPVGGIEEIQRLQRALHHMARKVQRAHESLRGYIGAITTGQEEERRRLARELHDDTLQDLIALQQRIQLARLRVTDDASQRVLQELQGLVEASIRDLRGVIHNLRPLYLEDLGLLPALEMLVKEVQEQQPTLRVELVRQGEVRRLDPAQELALYRIVQEGLSNIVRHSRATWAQVVLRFEAHQVTLEVRDNGQGFRVPESPAEFAHQGHYGLLGMHERAELIGASLSLASTPGQGTVVRLTLALQGEGDNPARKKPTRG